MIQLFEDPTFAVFGMIGLSFAGYVLVKVYGKVISKLH